MWTCEYCFSHYVAAAVVIVIDYWLLVADWRGRIAAWVGVVAIANVYMSLYARLRVETEKERTDRRLAETKSKLISDTDNHAIPIR